MEFKSEKRSQPDSDTDTASVFSDVETADWETAKDFKLAFGKYKGRLLSCMIKTKRRRDYMRYLLGWDELRETTRANVQCALDTYKKEKQAHYKKLKTKK